MPLHSFTLGIEEEFQLVKQKTGELIPYIDTLLKKGDSLFRGKIKYELYQPTVELVSDVYPDITFARKDLYKQRNLLAHLIREDGIALMSSGTHPTANWQSQKITQNERYLSLVEELQDAIRCHLVFGLHIHVGLADKELAIKIMNQVRTWLPHLLALSSNSPFWQGRFTGMKSYRSVMWQIGPRNNIPDSIASLSDFNRYIQDLQALGFMADTRSIWWDVRLNPIFDTIEFRVCDMPSTVKDTLALAGLCQALVAKLVWLHEHAIEVPVLPRDYITENKWRTIRYGLDAVVADFVNSRSLGMRDAIYELLEFVEECAEDLGSQPEMEYLRALLASPEGTGADRQIAIYKENNDIAAVIDFLMRQTMDGLL